MELAEFNQSLLADTEYPELQNLKVHAKRLETLLKNLPGMAYRCLNEKHWPMDFVSYGCYELCGYTRHEIESQEILWGEFVHPDDVNMVDKVVRTAVDKGEPFEVEYRIITKLGIEKWVWERGRQVDVQDDGIGILEGLITDITRIKKSETELINSKAYADAIVESAAEGIITIDTRGYIESMNYAAQSMFGYSLEQALKLHARLLIAHEYRCEIERYIEKNAHFDQSISPNLELEAIRKNREVFPISVSISRINNVRADRYVILIRDLTARRAAEQEAREQRELLAHVDRLNTLGEMAAAIAHEINQPLTAISMYSKSASKFLNKSPPKVSRADDALVQLSSQAHRAGAVMERMQSLATRHEGKREIVDPQQLLTEVFKLAKPYARVRDFYIILDLAEGLLSVYCDPIQIQQVILNLLRNGMDSMKSAGRMQNSEIILRAINTDSGIEISIEDCGIGITSELKKQLYLPFVSTKASGMGLGLSISQSIVSSHGSKLGHYNNKKGGATFHFALPHVIAVENRHHGY